MRTDVPEKILKIIDDIDMQGNLLLTRLTVLKNGSSKRIAVGAHKLRLHSEEFGQGFSQSEQFGEALRGHPKRFM